MGYRSTFTTSDYRVKWPDWFRQKYEGSIHFPDLSHGGPISAKAEFKCYGIWEDLNQDIQKCLPDDWWEGLNFNVCYLHEDAKITLVRITKDSIKEYTPEWSEE